MGQELQSEIFALRFGPGHALVTTPLVSRHFCHFSVTTGGLKPCLFDRVRPSKNEQIEIGGLQEK